MVELGEASFLFVFDIDPGRARRGWRIRGLGFGQVAFVGEHEMMMMMCSTSRCTDELSDEAISTSRSLEW